MASSLVRRFLLAAALGAAACATTGSGQAATSSATSSATAQSSSAGDFTLHDVEGRTVHLSDYAGKVVLIDFWATWCEPCMAELPHLQDLYKSYKDKGLVVLGVSMDGPETMAGVAPAAQRLGLDFPVLLDEQTVVTAQFNPRREAPLSVLIDRSGRIARTRSGYTPGDEQLIETDIKGLLGP